MACTVANPFGKTGGYLCGLTLMAKRAIGRLAKKRLIITGLISITPIWGNGFGRLLGKTKPKGQKLHWFGVCLQKLWYS